MRTLVSSGSVHYKLRLVASLVVLRNASGLSTAMDIIERTHKSVIVRWTERCSQLAYTNDAASAAASAAAVAATATQRNATQRNVTNNI